MLILNRKNKKITQKINKLTDSVNLEREISFVSASLEEFQKERLPLYTAVKKEGQIVYGRIDVTLDPNPPEVKYGDFFKISADVEKRKIETAEYLMKKKLSSGVAEYAFIASKHAIQAGLAMRGAGFSSKVGELIKYAEKYFGPELAGTFKLLFKLYVNEDVLTR